MKYGETLRQRSIPEWGPYNIDYNEIKHLIKARTTDEQAQAVSIPGRNNEEAAIKEFEDVLFAELSQQHERIGLFVRSKSGEIERRLKHLHKQVDHLQNRHSTSKKARIPVRRLERYSKAEEDVLKAGEEVQFLSRFVGAQRLAFHKLLKKYKRWTGSAGLGKRFLKEVIDRPNSFTRSNFEQLLAQWIDVLTAVRAPFKDGFSWKAGYGEQGNSSAVKLNISRAPEALLAKGRPDQSGSVADQDITRSTSSAEQIQNALDNGSELDFDTAVATSSLDGEAGKAIYWVHPDNLVELQVLLLQYMTVPTFKTTASSPGCSSPICPYPSRPSSSVSQELGDKIGLMVFDDLDRLVESQRHAMIRVVEDTASETLQKAVGTARWCGKSEAVVRFGISLDSKSPSGDDKNEMSVEKAKLKVKNLAHLFDSRKDSSSNDTHSDSSTWASPSSATQGLTNIRSWLEEHDQVHPLAQIDSRRKRFIGLANSSAHGVWALIDRNIRMEKPVLGAPRVGIRGQSEMGSTKFPYAVLEVRSESKSDAGLARILDESHLTERVNGFSLETHAIYVLHKPKGMPPPSWLPSLNRDIRKVPAPAKRSLRKTLGTRHSPESANTETSSLSAASTTESPVSSNATGPALESSISSAPDMLQSSPISAFKKKKNLKPRGQHAPHREVDEQPRQYQQRYWNEFDDGSEASGDEGYVIYVDPDAKSTFPGAAAMSRFASLVVQHTKGSSAKVKAWLQTQLKDGERRPLLSAHSGPGPLTDGTQDGRASLHPQHAQLRRAYSTFGDVEANNSERSARHSMLLRTYIGCFLASATILAISAVLALTGRHRSRYTVDAAVLCGVVAALVFAVVGVGLFAVIGRNKQGWLQRSLVLLIFAVLCVAGSVLLAFVTGGL